jgi:hypothetical protein
VRDKQVQMTLARSRLERMEVLYQRGGVGRLERDQAKADAELAEIRFQYALLEMMGSQPRLSVERAVKYRDAAGAHYLDLTIRNATLVLDAAQRKALSSLDVDNKVPIELLQRRLENVYVSIGEVSAAPPAGGLGMGMGMAPANVSIALPYEARIPELDFDQVETLRFKLLADADRFNVRFAYRGNEQSIGIYPEQRFAGADVELASNQIAQEADLGSTVDFPFVLRRSGQDTRTFSLRVRDLPGGMRHAFVEPESRTRLSEIRLSTGEQSKNLALRLELPDRHTQGYELDHPLPFVIEVHDGSADGSEATALAVLDLKLVVRGTGQLVVNAPALVHELGRGETVPVRLSVRNEGSRSIEDIVFASEHPLGWRVEFDPPYIETLAVGAEREVAVLVEAASAAAAGDFELRMKTSAATATRPLAVEDKVFRLTIKRDFSLLPIALVLLLFAAVVAAIVYVGRHVRMR